jgi:hypothetical protein
MTSLREIYFGGAATKVTRAGVQELANSLPKAMISFTATTDKE